VGIAGEPEPGPVTVVRIGGKELRDLYAVRGQLVECGEREDLCRTQLAVKFDRPEDARILLTRPLGNHHVIVRGDWMRQINAYRGYFHNQHA
jgi:L-fucose isomerase-like protein